ncbi:MAG TPA: PQQ-binding-like beta-propeller repeat protein [Cellulomonas sp.]|uniref:outer membrane protein assembly factor BamB family protein n=1 Tax=Cellulomonas sp. TaxID=40001 RepID=UPI002E2EE32C|nr:PQQ-binding-like beta-propeller repeat protein [Cellulomonas sp.]HEX5332085.1 PQQ-binding-like beta-propeller repeat protein [Cellulomonas sp.]
MGRELMQPVELSDEPVDGTGPATTGSGTPTGPAATRRWGRRRRWALAVAATLVVGLVGTQAVLDARERVHLARLATVPGVLAPVDASIRTLWSSSDWSTIYSLAGGTFGDLSIGAYIDDAGVRTARAVRTRTGEVVWTTVLSAADPVARSRGARSGPACSVDERAAQVVCLVSDAARLDNADGSLTPVPATFARLVVLDPLTGRLVAQHDEPVSSALSVPLLDGLAVLASRSGTGHLVVVGEEPRTGEVRWRFESSDALADALPYAWSQDPSGLNLVVVADHIAVTASGGEVWVLTGGGDLIDHVGPGHLTGVAVLRLNRVVVVDYGPSASGAQSLRIVVGDGSLGAASDQQPVPFQVDDGSVPKLLFTMSDQLVAWDLTTGRRAWSSSVSVSSNALLLDGRLYTRTSGGLLYAIDAATGTTLWDVPVAAGPDGSVSTDGRSILAAEPSPTGPAVLVAFATDDGRRLWEAPLPGSVAYVWPFGRQLVGATEDGSSTVVLG